LQELVNAYVKRPESKPDTLLISFYLSRLLLHLVKSPQIELQRRDIHSGDSVRDMLLEEINLYVRSHLSQSVTIADIAEHVGYSVSYLRAVFRDRLGVSLGRYMRESRLSEAAQLLQSSDLNVADVSEKCGFESLFAFSRAFRKAYGIPPRAYGNLVKNGRPLPTQPERPLLK
jgi:AraC-like DNA-binding protein